MKNKYSLIGRITIIRIALVITAILMFSGVKVYGQASQLTPIGGTITATNSDDSFSEVSITSVFPFGIDFGGSTYTTMFIGTNGYVTFSEGFTSFTPTGIAGFGNGYPIIAAQFDDLHPGNGGDIYYNQNTGSNYIVATWVAVYPFNEPVGYGTGTTGTSFQIVLRKPAGYSSSNRSFQIEVRYNNIGWHQANIISPAWPTAGWSTGNQTSYAEMPYSGSSNFHLNQNNSNIGVTGVYRWDVTGGQVLAAPTVNQTNTASSVTGTSAVSGGNVSSDGGASVTVRGVVWSTSSMPSLSSYPGGGYSTDGGTGTGSFTSNLTGLSPSTLYYMRAYATNSEGAGYGPQQSFETSSNPPPANPTSVTASANPICNGSSTQLTANGAVGTVYWYTGSCGGTATSPTTGNTLTVSPSVTTTYYARNYNNAQFSNSCASITITVAAQPTAPSLTKNPNVASVCVGQSLTVSATSGAGGAGTVTDQYSYSTNNGSSWSAWSTSIPGFNAVVGTNLIRSRRTATASGCNESSYNQVSWNVVAQPTAPGLTKVPTAATICVNQMLTVTTTAGSGGTGTIADEYRFSTNNGTNWSAWSTSVPSFAAVSGTNLIQSRRTATGTGCNESSYTQVSWDVVTQPTAPGLTKVPTDATVCVNQMLTVTISAGSGGTGTIADEYRYSTNNGTNWSAWSTSVPSFAAVSGTNLIQSRRTATGTGCNESSYNQVSWGVYQAFTSGAIATTGETICSGTSAGTTIGSTTPASGGDGTITYKWQANGNDIANSDAANYLPGVLTQTTTFTRWAKDGTCTTEFAQSTGNWVVTVNPLLQYRSTQSGNWTTLANWEQFNGSGWVAATSFPGQISNDCSSPLVTIQTGHQMEIQTGSDINIPNLKIEVTGKLTIKPGGKIFVQDQLQLDESAGEAIIVESD